MMLLKFSMSPLGKGDSVSEYVAQSLEIVEQSGLEKVRSVQERLGRNLKTV